jgi:hypothetical protein
MENSRRAMLFHICVLNDAVTKKKKYNDFPAYSDNLSFEEFIIKNADFFDQFNLTIDFKSSTQNCLDFSGMRAILTSRTEREASAD